jgi:drug/metabolite transporter (DMT)-like permease
VSSSQFSSERLGAAPLAGAGYARSKKWAKRCYACKVTILPLALCTVVIGAVAQYLFHVPHLPPSAVNLLYVLCVVLLTTGSVLLFAYCYLILAFLFFRRSFISEYRFYAPLSSQPLASAAFNRLCGLIFKK